MKTKTADKIRQALLEIECGNSITGACKNNKLGLNTFYKCKDSFATAESLRKYSAKDAALTQALRATEPTHAAKPNLIERFEMAVRNHETLGMMEITDHAEINREYRIAKMLLAHELSFNAELLAIYEES